MKLIIGNKYKFIGDSKIMVYAGKKGHWHQFAEVKYPELICCKILNSHINDLEQSQ